MSNSTREAIIVAETSRRGALVATGKGETSGTQSLRLFNVEKMESRRISAPVWLPALPALTWGDGRSRDRPENVQEIGLEKTP